MMVLKQYYRYCRIRSGAINGINTQYYNMTVFREETYSFLHLVTPHLLFLSIIIYEYLE